MYLFKTESKSNSNPLQEHALTRSLRDIPKNSFDFSIMEKKHRCKLCFRNFANGRALGGHMRSHMMKFYAQQKASKQENGGDDHPFDRDFQSYSAASSLSSSSSEEEEYEEEREAARGLSSYELRENPKKSAVMVDHDFSSVVVVQDRESETESSKMKKSICRRSKRVRKSRISDLDVFVVKKTKFEDEGKEHSSPLSSISDTTPEEHVAHCLIMLSRDKWEKEEEEEEDDDDDDDDYEEMEELKKFGGGGDDVSHQDCGVAKLIKNKFRGKYRCEACNKLFRSYQALGGHRASHKKIKVNTAAPRRQAAAEAKIHQCPFCDRIFSSGQALGGHKRSHFIGAGAISTNYSSISPVKQNSRISEVLNIDLNLPAPVDDDEIAISVVSDAEFVHTIKQ